MDQNEVQMIHFKLNQIIDNSIELYKSRQYLLEADTFVQDVEIQVNIWNNRMDISIHIISKYCCWT